MVNNNSSVVKIKNIPMECIKIVCDPNILMSLSSTGLVKLRRCSNGWGSSVVNRYVCLSNFSATFSQSLLNKVTLLIFSANNAIVVIDDFGSNVNVFVVILH